MPMKSDFKTWMMALVFGLPVMLGLYIAFLAFGNCPGGDCTRAALPPIIHTPIPTLIPATLPAQAAGGAEAAGSKCTVTAEVVLGAWVNAGYPETDAFGFTDLNGASCEATFKDLQVLFTEANLWYSGALPCASCHNSDIATASAQMDLSSYAGIVAGALRTSPDAKGQDILGGGVWEQSKLRDMLFVQKLMPLGRPAGAVPDAGPTVVLGTQKAAP